MLSSKELVAKAKGLVAEERRVTLALIEVLEEIEARWVYAEMGYGSLWEFALEELGLSEGAAQRRIKAMRLTRDVPEAKGKLASGSLTLSNAAQLQSFRQSERRRGRKHDARALVSRVERLSQNECTKALFEISPGALPQERERVVSADGSRELKIVVSADLHEKLTRLKGLLAHALGGELTYEALLDRLATEELARIEKKKGLTTPRRNELCLKKKKEPTSNDAHPDPTAAAAVKPMPASRSVSASKPETAFKSQASPRPLPSGRRVYLPVSHTRPLWPRAQGQCEFVSSDGRRCTSRHRLEIDHRVPLALGGSNDPTNLRLLCRVHNQQQALVRGLPRIGE